MSRLRFTTKLGLTVIAGTFAAAQAGAAPDLFQPLPEDARDLSDMQWEKRPVLLFAPSEGDPSYRQQMTLFRQAQAELAERDIVVLSDLDPRTPSPLRQGFQPGGFMLVLVGKDGGVKLEQDAVMTPGELFAVIDRMPMRRREASQ